MTGILKVDTIQKNDGTVPTAADLGLNITGSVLQVVQTRYKTANTFAVNAFTDTGLAASITPSSSSSKILVTGYMMGAANEGGQEGNLFRLYRNTGSGDAHVSDADGAAVSNRIGVFSQMPAFTGDNESLSTVPYDYLDSPNTTSAITYKIYCRGYSSGYPVYINRSLSDIDRNFNNRGVCVMTLMEIAG
jgi:hypothetical protein